MTKYLCAVVILLVGVSATYSFPLGFGFPTPDPEIVVYESQNVYGTYQEKQRQVAIREGIRPLVDTIHKEEQYGNSGSPVTNLGRAVLSKTQAVSYKVGSVFDGPTNTQNSPFKQITAALNRVGHSLVGL